MIKVRTGIIFYMQHPDFTGIPGAPLWRKHGTYISTKIISEMIEIQFYYISFKIRIKKMQKEVMNVQIIKCV